MKILYLSLILLSFSCTAATNTISKQALVGSWIEHKGFGFINMINTWFDDEDASLVITPDYEVILKRIFDNEKTQTYNASPSDIKFVDGFLVVTFNKEKQISYKLVISGWQSERNKLIFGYLYFYRDNQMFNGVPVAFKPKTTAKSKLTQTAIDAVCFQRGRAAAGY